MSRKLIERDVLARIRGLLDMWYTSLELAEELKVSPLLIRRRWVRSGLPHRREQRSIWIRGTDLMHWANQQRRERQARREHPRRADVRDSPRTVERDNRIAFHARSP